MGLATFAEMSAALKFRNGGNDAFDSYYGGWINRGYMQLVTGDRIWGIKRSLYFPELETDADKTTTASVAYVAKPTDCLNVIEIYDTTNNTLLNWMSWSDYVSRTDRTVNTGKPILWTRRGDSIYVYPTPDATYTLKVYYRKIPAVLTGAAVTAIGQEWDDIILDMADYNARMWAGEYDKAKIMKEAALERIATLVTVYDDEQRARRERISPDIQMVWGTY
jgi:hypothetical protein